MSTAVLGPGDDVEAWCTRCRMNLNHRIIAVVGTDVRTVHCLTCGGDHRFHPPKYEKKSHPQISRVVSIEAGKTHKIAEKAACKAAGEWRTFMKEMPPGTILHAYKVSGSFQVNEYIDHPFFGAGRVIDIVGVDKIQVVFRDGRKTLICNKNNAS